MEIIIIPIILGYIYFIYRNKENHSSIFKVLLLFWTVMSLISYAFILHPDFVGSIHDSGEFTFGASFYLIVVLLLWIYPLSKYKFNGKFILPDSFLIFFSYICIFLSVGFIIVYIPAAIKGFNLVDISMNKEAAIEGRLDITDATWKRLLALPYSYIRILIPFLSMYLFSRDDYTKSIKIVVLLCAVIPSFLQTLALSSRNYLSYVVLELLAAFFVFSSSYRTPLRRRMYIVFSSIGGAFITVMIFMSFNRFASAEENADYFIYKYAGEGITNFNGLLYEDKSQRYDGDLCFPIVRRMLGMRHSETAMERRAFWETKVDFANYLFYTFIGSFFIDLGWWFTLLFSLLCCIIFTRAIGGSPKLHKAFLAYFLASFCLKGVFYNAYQDISGNIALLWVVGFYFFMKYHPSFQKTIVNI